MCSITAVSELDALTVEELKAVVLDGRRRTEAATAFTAAALAALDARGGGTVPEHPADPSRPPVDTPLAAWLRAATTLGLPAARRLVEQALAWAAFPAVQTAAPAGRGAARQAGIIPAALQVLTHYEPELAAAAVPVWVDYAADTDPDKLRARIRDWIAEHAPLFFDTHDGALDQRRRVCLSRGPDGMGEGRWRLTPTDDTVVRTALDALAAPTGRDDTRSLPQRRADALVELCARALAVDDDLPETGGHRPHLSII